MSFRLARMVDVFDPHNTIRAYDDDGRFTETTPDVEWIRALSADSDPPWIIISADGRILKNKIELAALKESNLSFFCLSKQWLSYSIQEQAWRFIKVWPGIVENAKGTSPKIFEVAAGQSLKIERRHL